MTGEHERAVDALAESWAATSTVLHDCIDADWYLPTGCPGWTVKDQLAHMVWSARLLVGKAPPDIEMPELAHVTNAVKAYMELDVEARRPLPGVEVLAEFDGLRHDAIADLRGRLSGGFHEPFAGPMGKMLTRADYLPIALFDQWTHGEDIRAALDVPGDLDSPAARTSLEWIVINSASGVQPLEFNLTPPGTIVRTGDGDPVCTITMRASDLLTLATGRERPILRPRIEGERHVAQQVLDRFPLTP